MQDNFVLNPKRCGVDLIFKWNFVQKCEASFLSISIHLPCTKTCNNVGQGSLAIRRDHRFDHLHLLLYFLSRNTCDWCAGKSVRNSIYTCTQPPPPSSLTQLFLCCARNRMGGGLKRRSFFQCPTPISSWYVLI